jgi:pimeloyl-ACP methyl ester carboxylesterase
MTEAQPMRESVVEVRGLKLRMQEAGQGDTVLFLHGAAGAAWAPLHQHLSAGCRVLVPEHPGYGRSQIPEWMMSAGDLAFFYLDVLDALDLRDVHLVGHCLGGWIAAEMAIRSTARMRTLTLMAPAGVAAEEAAFGDIFLWNQEEFARRQFHDAGPTQEHVRALAEADIDVVLQNRAASARLAWSPRLENPQLRYWLHRIDVPAMLVWGRDDAVTPFACHRSYLEEIRGIRLLALPQTGHALPIERAAEIGPRLVSFLQGAPG